MATQIGPETDLNWSYPGSNNDVPTIHVLRPTMEEFKDFNKFTEHLASTGANLAGLTKIIPPKEWVARRKGYDIENDKELSEILIPSPICQVVIILLM